MNLTEFIERLNSSPGNIEFSDTMGLIDMLYDFTPISFTNGNQTNAAGENSGSCKLFAFAQSQGLSSDKTLACFGKYYRKDVLQNPDGSDHQNIRNFMKTGWDGITFNGDALKPK